MADLGVVFEQILGRFWADLENKFWEPILAWFFDDLVQILGWFRTNFGDDSGLILGQMLNPILQGAVGSHGGLKQHEVKKAIELLPLFQVGRN
jgi:hypothetical protein